MNEAIEEVIVSVQDYICRLTDKDGVKTDAEIATLPETINAFTGLLAFKFEMDRWK